MATGGPQGQIDLLKYDASIAVHSPQGQRMKGKLWKSSKDPFKITIILSICKKDPLNALRKLYHSQQDFPQVSFRSADLPGDEKERVNTNSQVISFVYGI